MGKVLFLLMVFGLSMCCSGGGGASTASSDGDGISGNARFKVYPPDYFSGNYSAFYDMKGIAKYAGTTGNLSVTTVGYVMWDGNLIGDGNFSGNYIIGGNTQQAKNMKFSGNMILCIKEDLTISGNHNILYKYFSTGNANYLYGVKVDGEIGIYTTDANVYDVTTDKYISKNPHVWDYYELTSRVMGLFDRYDGDVYTNNITEKQCTCSFQVNRYDTNKAFFVMLCRFSKKLGINRYATDYSQSNSYTVTTEGNRLEVKSTISANGQTVMVVETEHAGFNDKNNGQ